MLDTDRLIPSVILSAAEREGSPTELQGGDSSPSSRLRMTPGLFSLAIFVVLAVPPAAASPQRVLLVVANGASDGDRKSGYDLGELALAHEIFERNGFAVDIATPAGG